jgi:hypothetical protein
MPTPTYTPLATVTLGSAASSVTFSSIPATYRDLILVFEGTVASGAFARIQFNSDTASNYSNVLIKNNGSALITGDNIAFAELQATYNNAIGQIMDYSATDKHKTVLTRSNQPTGHVIASAGRWANTAAITSIRLFVSAGNYSTGSRFDLYGIAS